MADLDKMDRTWLCSVLFMDIVNYSSQSVELQMKWKKRFNGYLTEAIREVPESDRVMLDTGDGAAICFLGAPEVAMFTGLELCRSFSLDEREQSPGLRVRLGINLGPVKLVRDINGALNAIGDGINAGQRIMSFASENTILVSQSFFEVVSRLSDDYKPMFQLKGVETDKHIREHTVYHLTALGSGAREQIVANPDGHTIAPKPTPAIKVVADPEPRAPRRQWLPWLIAGLALAGAGALGFVHFGGTQHTSANTNEVSAAPPVPANTPSPLAPAASTPTSAPETKEVHAAQAEAAPTPAQVAPAQSQPAAEPPAQTRRAAKAAREQANASSAPSPEAKVAYDQGMLLIDQEKAADAVQRFDDAIRVAPNYVDAYVGRAEARRTLLQYDLSMADCNKVIQLKADDPRGYNCRGFARQLLKQFDAALPDFNQAIQLNPNFAIAYEHRGTTYTLLRQYDHAVEDYSSALRLAPRNPLFYLRRGEAYNNLKDYHKAVTDLTEAIRFQPNNKNAYRLRALAEDGLGDTAGAAADRARMNEAQGRKMKGRNQ
jgi:tetratricopeptide (TPR) repeat protein/class 3 adenylate cyclase